MKKILISAFVLTSLSFAEYTPALSRAQIIQKIDSLNTAAQTDSVVFDSQVALQSLGNPGESVPLDSVLGSLGDLAGDLLPDSLVTTVPVEVDSNYRQIIYASGLTITRESENIGLYTYSDGKWMHQIGYFSPIGEDNDPNGQYSYSLVDTTMGDSGATINDWLFLFRKGAISVEVSLDFTPVGSLKEGETADLNIYVARDTVTLSGVVSGIPAKAPKETTSFSVSLSNGEYTGSLVYNPEEQQFSIEISE